jgi:NADH dehydrogenase
MSKKDVLIVGGGFGGVKAALELSDTDAYNVTLISDQPNFRYYPAMYHTATGGSRVVSIIPLAELFADKDVSVVIDKAAKLDRTKKSLVTAGGQKLSYDILIMALGVVTNYFGIKGLDTYSYGMKTIEEAEEFKSHLHQQLLDEHKPDLNYVVVGAGPTGVELAGELPHYIHEIMREHGIRDRRLHIDIIEAAPRVLPRMPESVSKAVQKRLRKLGVKVVLGKPVQAETADDLLVGGEPIRSHSVIWTSGVTNHPFFKENGFILNERGKVTVDKLLQAWPGVFVIGDNADTPFSGMAQTALFDAKFVATNLKRHAAGKQPYSYKAKKPIYIQPVGPGWAAVVWGPLHFYGWAGWVLRHAADWIGYHDVEPWWRATQRLMAEGLEESDCPRCMAEQAS